METITVAVAHAGVSAEVELISATVRCRTVAMINGRGVCRCAGALRCM